MSQPEPHTDHLEHLGAIASEDESKLEEAETHYGSSWKQRGGVGAFMMLARKWDRIEKKCSQKPKIQQLSPDSVEGDRYDIVDGDRYDIFSHIMADSREEGILDDIRDLRRYLMLVESEMRARGVVRSNNNNVLGLSPEYLPGDASGAYVSQDPDQRGQHVDEQA